MLVPLLAWVSGCAQQSDAAPATNSVRGGCSMSGIVDYNAGITPGPDNASPEAALRAWATQARKDAETNIATYTKNGQANGWPYTADVAALGALNGVDEVLRTTQLTMEVDSSTARLAGSRTDGLAVDIALQGGFENKRQVWQVTNYSLDVPEALCDGLRKPDKG